MSVRLLFTAAAAWLAACGAPSAEEALRREAEGFDGTVGAALVDGRGLAAGIDADRMMPALSTFKFPVALAVLDRLDRTEGSVETEIEVGDVWRTWSPLGERHGYRPFRATLRELLAAAVSQSDNIACDALVAWTGGIVEVQRHLDSIGARGFDLRATERTMTVSVENQRLNRATPRATAELMYRFAAGPMLRPESRALLLDLLRATSTGAGKLRAGLPAGVDFGHKTGSSDRDGAGRKAADNDVGFVRLPDGRIYALCVFVADSPASDTAIAGLIARLSHAAWEVQRRQRPKSADGADETEKGMRIR